MFHRSSFAYAMSILSLFAAGIAPAAEVRFTPKGWEIDGGGAVGKVVLSYPLLTIAEKNTPATDVKIADNAATLVYPGGTTLAITRDASSYKLHYTSIASDVSGMRIEMTLPISLAGKADWSVNAEAAKPLPAEYAGQPFLFKGEAKRFALATPAGEGFAIHLPYGYQQLQDNREWKSKQFLWFMSTGLPAADADGVRMTLHLTSPAEKATPAK